MTYILGANLHQVQALAPRTLIPILEGSLAVLVNLSVLGDVMMAVARLKTWIHVGFTISVPSCYLSKSRRSHLNIS